MKSKKILIGALAVASMGIFMNPAWALFYSAPGPYELTVNGSYAEQNNAQGMGGPGGCASNLCGYVPADFAKSNMFNGAGNGTIYDFTFTIAANTSDYLNISKATGTEEFLVTRYTCGSSGVFGCGSSAPYTSSGTLVSGPTTIDDPAGLSLAFSAGGSAVNYLVQIQLNNGDDPTNYITLTDTATFSTPLPAALPLFASGLGVLGYLFRRRDSKAGGSVLLGGCGVMKMSKQRGLAVVFAAALSVGLPSVSHANTYLLNVDSGGNFISSVGTVGITSDGTTLTYQFNLTSGNLLAVYMDVTGSVSSLSADGSWTADQGATTTALGAFSDALICNGGCGNELTVTISGTDLAANFTLLNGNTQMFTAATTSDGFFGDTPCEAALTPFDGGITPSTLLAALTSAIVSPAYAQGCPAVTPLPAALPLFASGFGVMGLLVLRRKLKAQAAA